MFLSFSTTILIFFYIIDARTDFSVDVRAIDIDQQETTLAGLKVGTSGVSVPGPPTLNLVRPQGGQLEMGLQTTPLLDDGGKYSKRTLFRKCSL